ncbi:hypothetical protein ABFX02_06G107300 [Erythranthe guttata]
MEAKSLHFLQLIFFSIFLSSTANPTPQDNYFIKCGSTQNHVIVDNRYFVGDSSQKSSAHLSQQGGESISLNNPNPPPNSSALHTSARVFTSASTYSFQINNPGTHFLRLHFYPFSNANYSLGNGDFSVAANGFSLLSNFGADFSGVREFLLMADETEHLEILFAPTRVSNFAFVNAIEVFLAPKNLFFGEGGVRLISPDGIIQEFKQNIPSQIMETIHRVNVGGSTLTPLNDTVWRTWVSDEDFLVLKSASKTAETNSPPNYRPGGATRNHAPDIVYMTAREMNVANGSWSLFNITWDYPVPFGVDKHFVRLHFCDIVSVSLDTLYFNVYVNGITAYENVDLSSLAFRHLASPCYVDFAVKNTKDSGFLRISIGPSDLTPLRKNAILNGVEIMRIMEYSQRRSKKKSISILVVSFVCGFLALSLFLAMLALSKRKRKRRSAAISGWASLRSSFASPGPHGYYDLKIPFADIQLATNGFDESLIIGRGSFGNVYRGVLKDDIKVAVKRGLPADSRQGLTFQEFQTEITVLSRIRHCHLVSLVGFCVEQFELILVYEYMDKGPLRNHLYGSNNFPPLSWKQRLEICINAARGLHYLHTGSAQVIIHRDVKSSNILLDENYVAKISGFGLSRPGQLVDETHVSTDVKGSFGYQDPEYLRRGRVSEKSDVYSFGVVLVEVLCGRPVVDPLATGEEGLKLVEWAMEWRQKGMIERIVDWRIAGEVKTGGSLEIFAETAEKCLAECGGDRPSMGDVLWNLERAYQQMQNEC